MQKLLLVFIVLTIFLVTGCGTTNLDLDKIKTELSDIQTDIFTTGGLVEVVESDGYLNDMEDEYDIETTLGINSEDVSYYLIRQNKETVYAVIKPVDGKKVGVKQQLLDYDTDLKLKVEEYEDYLLLSVSNSDEINKEIIKRIKGNKTPLFSSLMEVSLESMEDTIGVKPEWVEEFLMKSPFFITNSNCYIIVKPVKAKYNDVRTEIDKYMANLEEQWKTYLPDQYQLVKDRMVKEVGGYLIYIISIDNDLVYRTIKQAEI